MLSWILAACHEPQPSTRPTAPLPLPLSTTPSTPAPTTSTTPSLRGMDCRPHVDNALRWDCTLLRDTPGPVSVTWSSAGETFTTATETDAVTLWGLVPSSEVAWTATEQTVSVSGRFRTGPLPVPLSIAVVGEPSTEHLLLNGTCGGLVWVLLASPDGTIRWIESSGTQSSGYAFDPPDSVLFSVQRQIIEDVGVDGARVRLGPFERPVHHDLAREPGGERLLVLNAEEYPWSNGQSYVLDGFYVLDGAGAVSSTWSLVDHLGDAPPPTRADENFWRREFPGSGDWAHANGITWTPAGDVVISFRYLDAVFQVAGPDRPDAGAVDWILAAGGSTLDSTFQFTTALPGQRADFDGQHHPVLHADGTLTLFDNGPDDENSRALTYRLDLATSVATLVEAIDLGVHCRVIGSHYRLPDGGALVTCADQRTAREYGPGETTARWEATVSCSDTEEFNVNHVEPVTLPGFLGRSPTPARRPADRAAPPSGCAPR